MSETWGHDYESIEVDPEEIRAYAEQCADLDNEFRSGEFISETHISQSAWSSWRSYPEIVVEHGYLDALPVMTAEGLGDTYRSIQGATGNRIEALRQRLEELVAALRETADAVENQDASNSTAISDTLDPNLDTTPDSRSDW